MREIKFRLWNIIRKDMNYEGGMGMIGNKLVQDEYNILMQFTGLKDKNGKEIYDKDKLVYRDESGQLRTGFVEWCDYQWAIIATCGDDEGNQDLAMHPDYSEDWEVIGNYYEGEILSNSSPPVRTSDKSDSANAEGFNTDLKEVQK